MNKSQTPGNHSSSSNTMLGATQKAFVLAVLTVMAVMTFWLASPQTTVSAQTACLLDCEAAYVACISSPDPPPVGMDCIDRYDQCVDACLGN
jgi:hypothetical protein